MENRRDFIKKAMLLSGAAGISNFVPVSIQAALAIDPQPGSSYLDAEHIVILMQENRSFDHSFGSLQGVRGFNDPRAILLPDRHPVWFQENEKGERYAPFRLDIKKTRSTWMGDLPHSRESQVDAHNKGKYDQWLRAKKSRHQPYKEMPLTMGHYTREDLPFYYAMADAFTICDQHFCSVMTSTTPNRSYFWTANIIDEQDGRAKANIRNTDFGYAKQEWKTFPELLSAHGVDWKFYQNEISCGGGFQGKERSWLSNFGCNLLEFFAAYQVKFAPKYVQQLQGQLDRLPAEIKALEDKNKGSQQDKKTLAAIRNKQQALDRARAELQRWSREKFEQLPPKEKQLYYNAFVTNAADPNYRKLSRFTFEENGQSRELEVPAGDIFYQFRKDVNEGRLPQVSWLAGPQNFSDHPSAPWYGAWYLSEILDILTRNPAVWQKTIFIITYDENDGYFDHIPPFSISDNLQPGTGKCAPHMDTEIEQVRLANELAQGVPPKAAREAPVGLGFRVPMIIASPWSRGGKVCSQLFEHTSTLQFLESFFSKKLRKTLRFDNINPWRRAISGDLTAAFSRFEQADDRRLAFLDRNPFIQTIFNAQYSPNPGFSRVDPKALEQGDYGPWLPQQEKGTRPACSLPYELYVNGQYDKKEDRFIIDFNASRQLFGDRAAGAPFRVYAMGKHRSLDGTGFETNRSWNYTVAAGHRLSDSWQTADFQDGQYELRVYGPNGFYRAFQGGRQDPALVVKATYGISEQGSLALSLQSHQTGDLEIEITDNAYGHAPLRRTLEAGGGQILNLPLKDSAGWYDITLRVKGFADFSQTFAGHVETGNTSTTDPLMGRVS